jgi:hypothetical protein
MHKYFVKEAHELASSILMNISSFNIIIIICILCTTNTT